MNGDDGISVEPSSLGQPLFELWGGLKKYKRSAYPLGTPIVGFRRYVQAHAQALVSGPEDFIPLDWHGEHTMRDALPLYVANKVPVRRCSKRSIWDPKWKSTARMLTSSRTSHRRSAFEASAGFRSEFTPSRNVTTMSVRNISG